MRTERLLVAAAAAVLCGCQATRSERPAMHAFVDASYAEPRTAPTPPVAPPPAALDPVTAELLAASYRCFEEQRRLAVANIANVNTIGYKRRVAEVRMSSLDGGDGQRYQVPVIGRVASIFTTGTLEMTERSLDVAIDGAGFFSIILADGSTGYTRGGNLHIAADGRLVTADELVVTPQITLPLDLLEIAIDPEGRVHGRTAGSPDTQTCFGQLVLHRFLNPGGLSLDGGIYRPDERSGRPTSGSPGSIGMGLLEQGFLERSNVQLSYELMHLQRINRQQEMLTRVLERFGMVAP